MVSEFHLWRSLGIAALVTASAVFVARADERQLAIEAARKKKDITHMTDAELRKTLTPEQYNVCKQNGTEPAFRNAYWDNHEAGLYVDVISGEPLFASTHKFDSGTGWPSFWEPVKREAVVEKTDVSHGMKRTEVRSAKSDAHLGHLFPDGPKPTGMRYCINSAALRFIPVAKLKEAGYGAYLHLFNKK